MLKFYGSELIKNKYMVNINNVFEKAENLNLNIDSNEYLMFKKSYSYESNNDIHSEYIEEYCRFLGYHDITCWDKLTPFEKHETAELALLNGSILKVKHKHLLQNVKNYK